MVACFPLLGLTPSVLFMGLSSTIIYTSELILCSTIHVKNWRPITLLNCDYKIAAKAVANRLRNVIPKIINNDQTGFLKGRFIGENIRLIDGIINHTESNKIPGLLLFLDFEKAFDTVE